MSKGELIIVGGTHGAGKSTLCRLLSSETGCHYISPQQINFNGLLTKNQTFKEILKWLDQKMKEKVSIVFEHVMSGGYIDKLIAKSLQNDYQIELIYIDIKDGALALERISQRVLEGGHAHTLGETVFRLRESRNNFYYKYRKLCHKWTLYDNSTSVKKLVAEGRGAEMVIHDDNLFSSFESSINN